MNLNAYYAGASACRAFGHHAKNPYAAYDSYLWWNHGFRDQIAVEYFLASMSVQMDNAAFEDQPGAEAASRE